MPAAGAVVSKPATCAQKIEAATVRRKQAVLTERMARDAECLFQRHDADGTGLLSRGSVTELLRDIHLDDALGDGFRATSRLAFDAHSADSHFVSLPEFKRLYYLVSTQYPLLLPRQPPLRIQIYRARGLPSADVNGKSDPYCSVQVSGKPKSRGTTHVIPANLDPVWNDTFDDKYCYEGGEDLEFAVRDYDPPTGGYNDKAGQEGQLLGRATLLNADFHRTGGFDGELPLRELPRDPRRVCAPTIRVKVVVNVLEAGVAPDNPDAVQAA